MNNVESETLTAGLVDLVTHKAVTPEAMEQAAICLLDTLASMWAGRATPTGQLLARFLAQQPANTRTTTFVAGAWAHITETDDLHRRSVTHPGCVVVPPALVLSRQHAKNGPALLKAIVVGYEAVCRVGNSVGPAHYKVWHNTATCGPFGSATACASLLGLDRTQTVNALGNAGTQSGGLWQFLQSGAMSKHLHAGRAGEAGVLAAELAALGFTGAADILEGQQGFYRGLCPDPSPATLLADPDGPWAVAEVSVKPWPSCRHTHPVIDAALEIHAQLGNRIIEQTDIETYQAALDVCDRRDVGDAYQARFSLQHCAAMALLQGEVTLASFDEAARNASVDIRGKTSVSCQQPWQGRYPQDWGARVSVRLADGETLVAERKHCKGDPEAPVGKDDMMAKAMDLLAAGGLSDVQARQLCETVLSLPDRQTPVDLISDLTGEQ